jgi:hypothetical protein
MSVRPSGLNYLGRIEQARGNGTVVSGQRIPQSVNFIEQSLMRRERCRNWPGRVWTQGLTHILGGLVVS